ncbi:MAG: nucleotidyltransferase domain-containing protein [Roseiflexaceae bacterium]|nr:nucleotidyltransferase domain-containing protein [Roseiflexaceae bacterium]
MKWPDAQTVERALREWAQALAAQHPDVVRVGYIGSYARGDWGVGSDVDVLLIVAQADLPFEQRAAAWDATPLPVPADLLVYTLDEWRNLPRDSRFVQVVEREARWVWERGKS